MLRTTLSFLRGYSGRHRRSSELFGSTGALVLLVATVMFAWRAIPDFGSRPAHASSETENQASIRAGEDGSADRGRKFVPASVPPRIDEATQARALRRFAALGLPIRCGRGTRPYVALTFDDGPGPYTSSILGMLRRARARATFFVVGKNLENGAAWAALPRQEWMVGEVGDHKWNHPYLPVLPMRQIQQQIERTKRALETMTGKQVVLFRPPFTSLDDAVEAVVKSLGMVEVVWSVDSGDSAGLPPSVVLSNVLREVRPGSIVIMHETRKATLSVLPKLLRELRHRGLQTVSVPELLALDPPTEGQLVSGMCP